MAAVWETIAFTFRTISTRFQQNVGIYLVFQIFILLAPLCESIAIIHFGFLCTNSRLIGVNAFDYMVLGRMIHFLVPSHALFSIPASTIAIGFVSLDIVSFVVQLVGGSWAGPTSSASAQEKGIHIYMGGIGLQQFFILVFIALAIKFQKEMSKLERSPRALQGTKRNWRPLLYTMYITMGLISVSALRPNC